MKQPVIKLLAIALFFCSILTSCELNAAGDTPMSAQTVNEEGSTTSKTLNLDAFSGISLTTDYAVYLKQGSKQSVKIEASQKVIDELNMKVSDGVWTIKPKSNKSWGWNSYKNKEKVKIYITIPKITALRVTGSGDIKGQTDLDVNDLKLVITGSGSIHATINGDDLKSTISGSGDMYLKGQAATLKQTITGSGDLKASDLKVKTAEIKITGSGTSKVNVSNDLNVRITGSGDVHYSGSPKVNSKITGSGNVHGS